MKKKGICSGKGTLCSSDDRTENIMSLIHTDERGRKIVQESAWDVGRSVASFNIRIYP